LHDRKRKRQEANKGTTTDGAITSGDDGKKIALVIEGGGMRGCVTAGMVCAIDYLGLRDSVDIVYGSSAGSIIGAYFVTGQLPWFGPEVYYDQLTTAGTSFIDTNRLFRALGLGLLNPKLLKDVLFRRNSGKPLLDLDFLLQVTMQRTKPLNWKTFVDRQQPGAQPLKIVASGLKSEKPLVMTYKDKHFESLEELAECMHASALLPGIAGPVANMRTTKSDSKPKFVFRNNCRDEDYEPLADALVYAPIPYEVALQEGATHMIILRSKPDGGDVIGKGGSLGEKLVWSRFFLRKNKLPKIYDRLTKQLHKKLYAKNVLELNEAAAEGSSETSSSSSSSSLPPTLTVAIPESIAEVPRLEVGRQAIFEGVRDGFARAYDALVEDPSLRGKGYEAAKQYFPDEILDYDPHEMLSLQKEEQQAEGKSAFETYLEQSGVWPKAWEGLTEPPLGCSSDRATATKQQRGNQERTGSVSR
jgi:predicted acylesterase/phospholipase RssA